MDTWTKLNVKQAIQFLDGEGFKLGWTAINSGEDGLRDERLSFYLGKPTTGSALYHAGKRLYGDWKVALAEAGITNKRAELSKFWDKDKIIKSILALKDDALPIHRSKVQTDTDKKIQTKLTSLHGRKTTGLGLVTAGINHFGNWENTLEAADQLQELPDAHTFWTPEKVIRGIQALTSKDISTSSSKISSDSDPQIAKTLTEVLDRRITGLALYEAAKKHFKGWSAAREAAGGETPKKHNRFWSQAKIIEAIQVLRSKQVSINSSELRDNGQVEFVLSQHFQRRVTGAALFEAAINYFESWTKARVAAGLPLKDEERIRFWTKDNIVAGIQALGASKISMKKKDLLVDKGDKAARILTDLFDRPVSGIALVAASKNYFGSWARAVRYSGVIVDWMERIPLTETMIQSAIHQLAQHDYPLYPESMIYDYSKRGYQLLSVHFGRRVTTYVIFANAIRMFGTWAHAVKLSGVQSPIKYSEASGHFVPGQVVSEWKQHKNGEPYREKQLVLGNPQLLPIEEIILHEENEAWERILERNGPKLKILLQIIDVDQSGDIEVWRQKLSEELGTEVGANELNDLFLELANDEDVMELHQSAG